MAERPILFSAPMIIAILDGHKTVTRRVVNLKTLRVSLPTTVESDEPALIGILPSIVALPTTYRARLNNGGAVTIMTKQGGLGVKPGEFHFRCPYADGSTVLADGGGRKRWMILPRASQLWVRETWCMASADAVCCDPVPTDRPSGPLNEDAGYLGWAYYRATDHDVINVHDETKSPWKPSIHMPRWASRITLRVVSVRIERLHEITDSEAKLEGVGSRNEFVGLWRKINGEASWEANPFTWRIEFERTTP